MEKHDKCFSHSVFSFFQIFDVKIIDTLGKILSKKMLVFSWNLL